MKRGKWKILPIIPTNAIIYQFMNKAFIFDFDGIIIDSEPLWEKENDKIFMEVYGEEIRKKVGPITGMSMEAIHKEAVLHGVDVPYAKFYNAVIEHAPNVYNNARFTPKINDLKNELIKRGFRLGIVSTSRTEWIEIGLKRLQWDQADFGVVLSLQDRKDLAHKPSPDGYIYTIKELGASPKTTLILEDSNPGIQSAKASGAIVIGFKQNLIPGYKQEGADVYAGTIEEVITITRDF